MFDALRIKLASFPLPFLRETHSGATEASLSPIRKRPPGQFSEETGDWLVLGESKWDGQQYIHRCGTPLSRDYFTITRQHSYGGDFPKEEAPTIQVDVSYCSHCERKPTGVRLNGEKIVIY